MTYHGSDECIYRDIHIHMFQIHVVQDLFGIAVQRLRLQYLIITVH